MATTAVTSAGTTSAASAALRASVIGVAAHVLFVVGVLGTHHNDPSWFVRFGAEARQTVLGRQILGSVSTHPGVGADGQYFWILARDPLLLNPQTLAPWLDRPVYRAQRIGYPAFAAPWRVFGERSLLWGLLFGNIAVVAIGSYLTARLAISLGLPARTALAFAFNPGVIFSTMFDLCDALALAATIGALYAAVSRKRLALACFSVIAGLTKEPAVLALGAAAALTSGAGFGDRGPAFEGKTRALLIAPAVLAVGAWGAYVRVRFGAASASVVEFAPPFVGLVTAWQTRWSDGRIVDILSAAALLIAACAVIVLFLRRRTLLLSAALPYALLVPFLSEHVMLFTTNALRAFAPAFTFLWLEVYRRQDPTRTAESDAGRSNWSSSARSE
jgi:hypothetical protein